MTSAANAAITIGSMGQSCTGTGCQSGVTSASIVNNTTIPNTLLFDTSGVAGVIPQPSGTVTGFFDFSESFASTGIFTLGAATLPNSTVQIVNLLTGSPLSVIQSAGPSANSLTFTTGLLNPGTTYRFQYTVAMGSPGDISGNAAFYTAAVPEPAAWALMLLGFGGIGVMLRRRRRPALAQLA